MTLEEITAIIRAENPTLRFGDDEAGYTEATGAEYEAIIAEWAQGRLDKFTKVTEVSEKIKGKLETFDKLTELGLDPKAFDLDKADLLIQKKNVAKDLKALGL
jgi:hypothetical protein